jgi:pimeloyl-ACP methyl ester carboxylesterase
MSHDPLPVQDEAYPPGELVRVRDGLRLCVREYHPLAVNGCRHGRTVVCLPGLTRNSRDFHVLARALVSDPVRPRRVVAIDARGRGYSEYDSDWKNYAVPVEAQDVIDVYAARGLYGSAIVGTSRGGLQTMVMGALQPAALGPVVLNDIGPVLERDGLSRIAGYVGRGSVPANWTEAADALAALARTQFPSVAVATWATVARQLYNDADGRPARGYDPMIGKKFSVFDGPPPTLWPQFATLKGVPLLILRGELSDLLSTETVRQMEARHPRARSYTIPGQSHAPLLMDAATISRIKSFLSETD